MDSVTAELFSRITLALKRSEKEIELLKEKIELLEGEVYDNEHECLPLTLDECIEPCITFSYDSEEQTTDSTFKLDNKDGINEYIDKYILFLNGLGFDDRDIQKGFDEATI